MQDFNRARFPRLSISMPALLSLVFQFTDPAAAGIRQCLQRATAVTALARHQSKGLVNAGRVFPAPDRAHSLEKKIVSLKLAYADAPFVDRYGNLHRQIDSFVTESGEELTMTDVVFTMNRTLTTTDMLPVQEEWRPGPMPGATAPPATCIRPWCGMGAAG